MERRAKARIQTGIYLGLVAAAVVLVNVFSFGVYKRWDLTEKERYTLSKGSKRLVSEGLKQELQVELYVTRGLPKYDAFVRDLVDLMGEYERASNGKLKFTVIEPKTEEERTRAKEAGIQEMNAFDPSETGEDQGTIARGFMGIAFKYGSEKEQIPVLSPDQAQGIEFWITNKIREVRDRADDVYLKFGIVGGKDEIKLTDANLVATGPGRQGYSIRGVMESALPFYKFEDVDLGGGENEINKELAGLIITQPGKDYTEKELQQIDKFVMLGNKAVVVIASAVNVKAADATMKGELNLHGLDKLLGGYGIEMKKEVVLDWSRPVMIPIPNQFGQVQWVVVPQFLHVVYESGLDEKDQLLDRSFAGFFRMDELALPFASPIVMHAEKQPNAKMKAVARSSPKSTVLATDVVDLNMKRGKADQLKPKGEQASRVVAVALEGKIKSAFGGGESAADSRILVLSSAQFLANPLARAGNPPPLPPQMAMMGGFGGDEDLQFIANPYAQKYVTNTILAFKNTLDWMGGDADLVATSAKLTGEGNLTYSGLEKPRADPTEDEAAQQRKFDEYKAKRKDIQFRVQWTLMLVLPLLFAGIGILRWRLREGRRNRAFLS